MSDWAINSVERGWLPIGSLLKSIGRLFASKMCERKYQWNIPILTIVVNAVARLCLYLVHGSNLLEQASIGNTIHLMVASKQVELEALQREHIFTHKYKWSGIQPRKLAPTLKGSMMKSACFNSIILFCFYWYFKSFVRWTFGWLSPNLYNVPSFSIRSTILVINFCFLLIKWHLRKFITLISCAFALFFNSNRFNVKSIDISAISENTYANWFFLVLPVVQTRFTHVVKVLSFY